MNSHLRDTGGLDTSNRYGLDSSTGRAADRYPEDASSNPRSSQHFSVDFGSVRLSRKNFSAWISEDDSEIIVYNKLVYNLYLGFFKMSLLFGFRFVYTF